MSCPRCLGDVRRRNRTKVRGVWIHKRCPWPDPRRTDGFFPIKLIPRMPGNPLLGGRVGFICNMEFLPPVEDRRVNVMAEGRHGPAHS